MKDRQKLFESLKSTPRAGGCTYEHQRIFLDDTCTDSVRGVYEFGASDLKDFYQEFSLSEFALSTRVGVESGLSFPTVLDFRCAWQLHVHFCYPRAHHTMCMLPP